MTHRVGRKVEAKILEQYPQEENERKLSVSLTIDNNELATASKTHLYNDEPLRNVGMALKMQQLRAMVIKKLIYGFRNRMLLMTQVHILTNLCTYLYTSTQYAVILYYLIVSITDHCFKF